jgi:TP901 family phage tail tape measure protein
MATGGAGGGGGAFPLGSAAVTLSAIPGNYFTTMARAQAALNSLGRTRVAPVQLGGVASAALGPFRALWGLARGIFATFGDISRAGVVAFRAIRDHGIPLLGDLWNFAKTGVHAVVLSAKVLSAAFAGAFAAIKQGAISAFQILQGSQLGKKFGQAWSFVLNKTLPALGSALLAVGMVGLAAFDLMAGAAGKFARFASPVVGKVARVFGDLVGAAAMFGYVVASWAGGKVAGAFGKVGAMLQPILNFFGKVGGVVAPFLKDTIDAFRNAGSAMAGAFGVAWKRLSRGFAAVGSAFAVPLIYLKQAFGNAAGLFGGLGKALWTAVGPTIGRIGSAFAAIFALGGKFAGGVLKLTAWMTTQFTTFAGWLGKKLAGAIQGAGKLAGGLLGAVGIGGLVGAVVGGFGIASVARTAATAETQMVTLQRVTGGTADEAKRMADNFNRMASVTGIGREQIFSFAEFGARLGVATDQLEVFTYDMSKMGAVLADIPLDEAATRVARLLGVFHLGTNQAIRLASALNALDMASTASARDILDITSRLSGMASTLGMTLPQAMALSTALREAGIPIETAGTSISQILTRMASVKDVKNFAKVAGLTRQEFEKLLTTDPLKAITSFEQGLQKLDKIKRVRALDALHLDGQRVRGTLLQLGAVIDRMPELLAKAEGEFQSTSSIVSGFGMVMQTLNARWAQVQNNFELLETALGTALMPIFQAALESLTALFRDLTAYLNANQGAITRWARWVAGGIRMVGVLFRNWSDIVGIAVSHVEEKWEQISDVLARIWSRMGINLRWAFDAYVQYVKNVFFGLKDFITNLFEQIARSLPVMIHNMIVTTYKGLTPAAQGMVDFVAPGIGREAQKGVFKVPAVRPKFGLIGNPFANIKPPPGFGDPLANWDVIGRMHQADRRPLLANIQQGIANQGFEENLMRAQLDAAANLARRVVEPAAVAPLTPGQRRREALRRLHPGGRTAFTPLAQTGRMLGRVFRPFLPRETPAWKQAQIDRAAALRRGRLERKPKLSAARTALLARRIPRLEAIRKKLPMPPDLPGLDMTIPDRVQDRVDQAQKSAKPVTDKIQELIEITRVLVRLGQNQDQNAQVPRWGN